MPILGGFGRLPEPEPEDPPPVPGEKDAWELGIDYRRNELEKLGVPYPLALEIAMLGGREWDRAERAVKHGATIEQLERIFC